MRKKQHWYLEGWRFEPQPGDGDKTKQKLVYYGDYYCMQLSPRGLALRKIWVALACICTVGLYLMLSFCGAEGSRVAYVGAAAVLALIPLMFLLMSVAGFLVAPLNMTYRSYYAGYRRLRISATGVAVLLGASAIGEGVYLCLHLQTVASPGAEVCFMGSATGATGALIGLLVLLAHIQVDIKPPNAISK